MNLDTLVVLAVLLFAMLGAFTGASKMIARMVGAITAAIIARLAGPQIGPALAHDFRMSPTVGIVLASLGVFIICFVFIRFAMNEILLRIFAGKEMKDRSLDYALGFILGGLRVGLICWFFICAVAFLEDNVSIAGHRLSVSPKDSVLFALARNHNLFQASSIPGVNELMDIAKAKNSPAYTAMRKDPRFRNATDTDVVQRAIESGDYRSLMENTDVLKMLQDPAMLKRLEEAAAGGELH